MSANWETILEDSFLAMRAGTTAQWMLAAGLPAEGAVGVFPTTIRRDLGKLKPGQAKEMFWAIWPDIEPGTVFPVGVTEVTYTCFIKQVEVTGAFYVQVGDSEQAPEPWHRPVKGTLDDSWAQWMPKNMVLPVSDAESMTRQLNRLVKQGVAARERVVPTIRPYVMQEVKRLSRSIQVRSSVFSEDDAIRVGESLLAGLADRFASISRPKASWGYAAHFELQKLRRHLWKVDLEPTEVIELRIRIQGNAGIVDGMSAEDVHEVLSAGSKCRWTVTQIANAMTPQIRFSSIEEQVTEGSELGDILPDHSAVTEPGDVKMRRIVKKEIGPEVSVTTEILSDMPESIALLHEWFAEAPFSVESVLPFFVKRGFVPAEDAGSVKVNKQTVERAEQILFSPFMAPGEYWFMPDARRRVMERAFRAFAPGGVPLPADEMRDLWKKVTKDSERHAMYRVSETTMTDRVSVAA